MNSTVGASSKQSAPPIKAIDSNVKVEDEKEKKVSDKRKADTDCQNQEFMLSLKNRATSPSKNFNAENRKLIMSLSSGRPLQERLNIPDGVDVF